MDGAPLIAPLVPDLPLAPVAGLAAPQAGGDAARAFSALLGRASQALESAQGAEAAFVDGSGSLVAASAARGAASVEFAIAAAAASRVAQAISTFGNMSL